MSRYSRRQFLEESMLATAAGIAAGTIAADPTRHVIADEPEKPKQSSSTMERIGVAVVGVGGRGGSHLSEFSGRKDTQVLYVVDVDEKIGENRATGVAKRQGRRPKVVRDLREALADKAVDIVTTATPNHWHSLVAIWAMQAGKDVYVEKPVSHNVSEGRRAVQVARKYGRICQTGTQCRSNPGMKALMKYIHDGEIGTVTVGRGLCYKDRPSIGPKGVYEVPKGVDYDLWSGPAPIAPLTRPRLHYDWHWQWLYGNGDLGNQGIHQMDLARWALGVDALSKSVFSYGGRFSYTDAGETANTQVVVHDFGDKTLVFEVRGLKTEKYKGAGVGVIVEGSEGYMSIGGYDSGAAFDKDGKLVKSFKGGANHFENFMQAVRSRKHTDLNADILEGHLSSALCHTGNIAYRLGALMTAADAQAALRSYKTHDNLADTFERFDRHLADNKVDLAKTPVQFGPPLAFDPVKEVFPGNDKANAMLTREYRKPFVVPAEGAI